MLDAYDALAARYFDEPYDEDVRAALLVAGDALQAIDDPRGTLIALEHAIRDATPERVQEIRHAMTDLAFAQGEALLGALTSIAGLTTYLRFQRALTIEWRAGRIYGVRLDARHIPPEARLSSGELVLRIVGAPAARWMRRLHVRVRKAIHADEIVTALRGSGAAARLEELVLITGPRPLQLATYSPLVATAMPREFPNLYLCAMYDRGFALPLAADRHAPSDHLATRILDGAPPVTAAARVLLGRALCSTEPRIRGAALARIAALGPRAIVFLEVLALMLSPRAVDDPRPIVECLRSFGPLARPALAALAPIPGRSAHYDLETRRAVGVLVAALRPPT